MTQNGDSRLFNFPNNDFPPEFHTLELAHNYNPHNLKELPILSNNEVTNILKSIEDPNAVKSTITEEEKDCSNSSISVKLNNNFKSSTRYKLTKSQKLLLSKIGMTAHQLVDLDLRKIKGLLTNKFSNIIDEVCDLRQKLKGRKHASNSKRRRNRLFELIQAENERLKAENERLKAENESLS